MRCLGCNYYSKIIGVQIQAGVIYMHMRYKDVCYIIWAELSHYSVLLASLTCHFIDRAKVSDCYICSMQVDLIY